jgi:hypothetical protein
VYNWKIWTPPYEEYAANGNAALCAVPAGVVPYTTCQESCLGPHERVYFQDGYEAIANALRIGKTNLMTLATDSTLENISFEINPINKYVRSFRDEKETLLHFFTRSGGRIRVTTNHPLVDSEGSMRDAQTYSVSQSLLTADGKADEIINIQRRSFFGKVYQVQPSSLQNHRNIYNAEGFLNGTANWQSESIINLNRIVLRSEMANLLK